MKRLIIVVAILCAGCVVLQPQNYTVSASSEYDLSEASVGESSPEPEQLHDITSYPVSTAASSVINNTTTVNARKNSKILLNKVLPTKFDTDILKQLSIPVKIEFSVPDKTNIDSTVHAQLAVTPETLADDNVKSTSVVTAHEKVSTLVEAKLTSDAFVIASGSPVQQVILTTNSTLWEWELLPKKPGTHKVLLTVDSIVLVGTAEKHRAVRTLTEEITVEVTVWQYIHGWLSTNWQWILSAIVIPLLVWKFSSKKAP